MELLDRLVKFSTIRPRSEFEIKRWLVRKKVSDKDSGIALQELKKAGLVDDEAFCHWWIEQRLTFRPKSRRALIFELVRRGVSKEVSESTLASSGMPQDEELARLVLEKRKKSLDRWDPETRKKRITNLLASRGFGWSTIRELVG